MSESKIRFGHHELVIGVTPPISIQPECLSEMWMQREPLPSEKAWCLGWVFGGSIEFSPYFAVSLPGDIEPTWAMSVDEVTEVFDSIFKIVNTGTDIQPMTRLELWDRDDYRRDLADIAEIIAAQWPGDEDMYSDTQIHWVINRKIQDLRWVDTQGGRQMTLKFSARVPSDADLIDSLPTAATREHFERGRATWAVTQDVWDEVLAIRARRRHEQERSSHIQVFPDYPGIRGLGEEEDELDIPVRGTPFEIPAGQEFETANAYAFMVRRLALGALTVMGTTASNVPQVQHQWMSHAYNQILQLANVSPKDERTLSWIERHAVYRPNEQDIQMVLKWVVPPGQPIPPKLRRFGELVMSFVGDIWTTFQMEISNQVPIEEGGGIYTTYYRPPANLVPLDEPWDEPGALPPAGHDKPQPPKLPPSM
jgi:hypothetical protein